MSLGLKGGFALAKSGLTAEVALSLVSAMALAVVVPAIGYALLVRRLSRFDAAAIAAIPEANPSLYFGMSLGLTFPFNILVGIPLYASVAQRLA
jgi:hypothetical protein